MQTSNRLFDDFARMASGAMSAASGVRGEFESLVRRQLERVLERMELVGSDEFDAVKEMAAKARTEQEALAKRVSALEASGPGKSPRARKTPTKKRATKKASGAKKPPDPELRR